MSYCKECGSGFGHNEGCSEVPATKALAKRDFVDVSLWCQLCGKNIGEIKNTDPHERSRGRGYLLGIDIHSAFLLHQGEPEHMKLRREHGLTD